MTNSNKIAFVFLNMHVNHKFFMCFSLPALNEQWKTSNSVLYDHHYKHSFSLNYLGLHALDMCPVVQTPDHLLSVCMIQCPNFSNQTYRIDTDNFLETDIFSEKKNHIKNSEGR